MNTKTRTHRILASSMLVILALVMVFGIFLANPMEASAATNRAGAYYLYGTYDIGDGSKSGYLSDFKIQISTQYFTDDSATNGTTKYNNATYNWTYFNFYIYATDIDSHTSFKLTRNGSTYTNKSLSGDGSGYLYQGALSDGDYVLTYVGTYWDGIFSKKTYTFTYKFTVDTTSPYVSLKAGGSTISSGSYTNKAIAFSASDTYSSTKIYYRSPSSSSYTYTTSSSKSVSATSSNNGWWYFYATDGYQSSSTYSVYLDTVAPVGKITNSSGTTLSSGSYTNKPVKFTATDTGGVSYYQVKNPGSSSWTTYSAGTALSSATGWYTFRAVDKAGNVSSEYKVYYDATLPTGTLYGGTSTKSSGSYTNASYIKYVASDSHSGISACYVKKPGSSSYVAYTSGTQLTAEGTYYFYCKDVSGNYSSTVSITLDKTAPTGTLYGGTTTKSSGSYTNASYVKYVASDSLSGVSACYVKMPGATYYTSYSSGTQLATQGTYYFYCIDRSSNQSSVVSITLDTTAPTGTLYGGSSVITSGTHTNASYIKFVPSDNIGVSATYVKKPGASSYTSYTSGTQLTAEGEYTFYCVDASSNKSAYYTVTIDRQTPNAQLWADDNPMGNGSYTNAEYISFQCDEECFVKQPGSTSFTAYVSGTEFNKPGKYVFYGLSDAGNSTGEYTIIIDRTIKSVTISNVTDGKTNGDAVVSWTNGEADTYAPIKSVTINGKSVSNGETIHTIDTGVYNVVVTDAAGNKWTTSFTSTKKNVLTDTLQKEYFEIHDENDEVYSFASYDNAFAFAVKRENTFVRTGTWNSATWDTGIAMDAKDSANAVNGTYYIYKKSGAPNEEVAYFTLDRLNEVIAEYAAVGIESYYYWEKEPATIAEGENLFSYSDSKTILANKIELGSDIGIYIDGEEFVGTVIETEGTHAIEIHDDFGNVCEYNIIVVRNAPSIQYAIGEGSANTVTFDRTYYFKDKVVVSITDALDEFAMFRIYDEEGELIAVKSVGETFEFTASGTYNVIAVNHSGDSQTFKVIISTNAPSVTLTEDADNKQLVITINESADKESHLQTLEILKSTDGGQTWETLVADDYGNPVELDILVYKFRTSGMYKVTITDEFRTGIDAIVGQITYTQPAPTGDLAGVENNGVTNSEVTFTWEDEAIVTVLKNDEVIEYNSGDKLTEDGSYTIVFESYDGHKSEYHFEIDTVEPEVKMEGADHRESVNTDVKVFYTEENLTAELFKDGKSLGEYTSGNPISADGQYRVRVADTAGNEVSVEFTIDKSVNYDINVYDGGLSNSVVATANEQVTVVLTKDGTAVDYSLGTAITEPADYVLVLTDALNNRAEISFTIVDPIVKAFSHNFDDIEGMGGVTVNGNEHRLNYGTLELTADGKYEVGVIVGGETYTFTITVDTKVGYAINAHDKGYANSVTINATEDVTVVITKNGEAFAYTLGSEITEPAVYTVTITDALGNKSEMSFTIVEPLVQKFECEIDLVPGFEKATVNGVDVTLDRGALILSESGTYEVGIVANGVAQTFTVTVDATAPTLTITGIDEKGRAKDAVILSDLTEEATVKVYLNDTEIEYKVGDELTEEGSYKVVVTDACGNSTEYAFEIDHGINGGIIALIIILSILLIGGVVVFILYKKTDLFDKNYR